MTDAFPQPSEHLPSRPVGDDWRRLQREMARREPELAVDSGTLTVGASPMGYRVEVEGRGLHKALSPPEVTVGGTPVTDLEFSRDGTSLRGRVGASPPNTEFVIDYGSPGLRCSHETDGLVALDSSGPAQGAGAYSTA